MSEWNFNHSYSKSNLHEALRIPRFRPSGSAKTAAPLPSIAHTKLEDHVQSDNICNQQKEHSRISLSTTPNCSVYGRTGPQRFFQGSGSVNRQVMYTTNLYCS